MSTLLLQFPVFINLEERGKVRMKSFLNCDSLVKELK
jgi:hypothetical protein